MRNLVQPLPSTRCEHCKGELLFKRIESELPALDMEVQLFVCAKCGRERLRKLIHERYTAHTATVVERKGGLATVRA